MDNGTGPQRRLDTYEIIQCLLAEVALELVKIGENVAEIQRREARDAEQ